MSFMAERRLLIIEDDEGFARTLSRSFERRGYVVRMLHDAAGLPGLLESFTPGFAVVDLRLGGASGLGCVATLHANDAKTRIVVLTGFASISTAVEAVKLGATNYLTKPSDSDDIERAFGPGGRQCRCRTRRAADLDQDAGMGAYPPDAGRCGLQRVGGGAAAGDAPPHARAEAREAARVEVVSGV
jgi:ActR/RegA family two-component response regulator